MSSLPYVQPAILADALSALSQQRLVPLAGGTDFYPARVGQPVADGILDLSRLTDLCGLSTSVSGWRLGALTTWSALRRAPLPAALCALQRVAAEVGGVQIQNAGTVGGNLCNASPAADGVPALLALDAQVELQSVRGTRTMPLGQFILGNRRTARAPDELLTAVLLPHSGAHTRSTFHKLGARRYLVISVLMVAARLDLDDSGRVAAAAVAVGACSEVAQRLPLLEQRLAGRRLDAALREVPHAHDLAALTPRSDVRASAAYRRDAALTLVRRALGALCDE
ncbi:MAG: FAD binding domain-containing protein [Burkholderiales bacterium]|nr:FAD binding domain-containing protein [Burkholderiales bacterium]